MPALEPTLPITPREFNQRSLDDLYWDSDRTVRSIAKEFGVSPSRLPRMVTPTPAGIDCWFCQQPLVLASRSARESRSPLPCRSCGAITSRVIPISGTDSDAVIMVTTTGRRSPKDLSNDVRSGVDALGRVDLRWCGRWIAVDVRGGPEAVSAALAEAGVTTVVIASIRSLGISQGDALCAFRSLLCEGMRVITADDWRWAGETNRAWERGYEREYGGWDDHWYASSAAPTWKDEYWLLGVEAEDSDLESAEEKIRRWQRLDADGDLHSC